MFRRAEVIAAAIALALTSCARLLQPHLCVSELTDAAAGWAQFVATEAELRALRQYPQTDPAIQAIYVAAAQAYYAREYELRLAGDPRRPAVAARHALQSAWRPGR